MATIVIKVEGSNITPDVILDEATFTAAIGSFPGEFEIRVKDANEVYGFKATQNITLDIDGARSFDGFILQSSRGFAFDVVDTAKPQVLMWTLRGVDINYLFQKRVTYKRSAPAQRIPDFPEGTYDDDALDTLVASYLDLSSDSLTTDFDRVGVITPDEPGLPFSIGDTWQTAMSLIAHLPGGVYGIRPDRTIFYEDDDTESAPFRLSDTPNNTTSFGYSNLNWTHDGTKLLNDSLFWGAGIGSPQMIFARVQDAASVAEHGRWQAAELRTDIFRRTSATRISTSKVYGTPQHLHGGKDDAEIVTCRVRQPGLKAGDKVHITSNVFDLTKVFPIRRIAMTFPNPEAVLYDLQLSYDIDRPLSYHNWLKLPIPPTKTIPPTQISCWYDGFNRDVAEGLGFAPDGAFWRIPANQANYPGQLYTDGEHAVFNGYAGFPSPFYRPITQEVDISQAGIENGEFILKFQFTATAPADPAPSADLDFNVAITNHGYPNTTAVSSVRVFTELGPRYENNFLTTWGGTITASRNSANQTFQTYLNDNLWFEGHNPYTQDYPPFSFGDPGYYIDNSWVYNGGQTWLVECDVSISRGDTRTRAWLDGNEPPPWQDHLPGFYSKTTIDQYDQGMPEYGLPAEKLVLRFDNYPTGGLILLDWVKIECGHNAAFTGSVALGSFGCEIPTRVSGSTYHTSKAYLSGSLDVYVNGIRQRKGPDYVETTDQTFTFGSVPDAASIYVCYFEKTK